MRMRGIDGGGDWRRQRRSIVGDRQDESERAAAPLAAGDLEASGVGVDDVGNEGETEAGAFDAPLDRLSSAHEPPRDRRQLARRYSQTFVRYRDGHLSCRSGEPQADTAPVRG